MNIKLKKFSVRITRLIPGITVLLCLYILLKYFLDFFAPFITAVVIAAISEPVVLFFEKRLGLPRKIAVLISLSLTVLAIAAMVSFCLFRILRELASLQNNIVSYINIFSRDFQSLFSSDSAYYQNLPEDIAAAVADSLKSLAPKLREIFQSLIKYSFDAVRSIPRITVFMVTTLLATYFISSDRRMIMTFIRKQLSPRWAGSLPDIWNNSISVILGYFKALFILTVLTFAEVSTGLLIMGMDYAFVMGLLVAICDAVPMLGTWIIMLPWIAWHLLFGNVGTAFGLAMIFLLGGIMRQLLEPKIVGNQTGLHPLVTLVSMYAGANIFGLPGMLLGPISVVILTKLQESGAAHLWKD